MDRNAIVLYLREVRDLEFAQRKIIQTHNLEKKSFEKEEQRLIVPHFSDPGDYHEYSVNIPWAGFIGGGILVLFIAFPLLEILGIYLLYKSIKQYNKEKQLQKDSYESYKESIEMYKKDMERIEGNKEEYAIISEQWNKKNEFWHEEYDTVTTLLNNYYALNILPQPYRNIQSVYYLYDYMSTSKESLSDAFLHEHMENGIQKILARLDQIVAQNEEIIFSLRRIEAQNQEVIDQNYTAISSLEKTKETTQEISKKMDVGNNYLRATTYFSAASYLDEKKKNY